ncbi:MAG TPA: ribose 5-phosphate isomerase B [Desulfotignum sp.]|nr:ribose 5-phosphate isomerase B [Desulfotignum sp.]
MDTSIIIGSDHAGFELKEKIRTHLSTRGYTVEDAGTFNASSVNYVDYGKKVAAAISQGRFARGILVCGSGIGMSMAANRYPGVRAAVCSDLFSAMMSRRHNDANILALGSRISGDGLAIAMVDGFLDTKFDGGRHLDRIRSMDSQD